jgi:hypothetical protein
MSFVSGSSAAAEAAFAAVVVLKVRRGCDAIAVFSPVAAGPAEPFGNRSTSFRQRRRCDIGPTTRPNRCIVGLKEFV